MFGQGGATGAITGTVSDATGAVIPNAEVKIINKATGEVARTLKTDSNGLFNALLMPVGTYDITVTAPGFGQGTVADVAVRVTETTRMYARLNPQRVTEQVEVQSEVQTIETTTAATGESIEARTIRTLPLATQNFQQLLSLTAGTASDLNASAQLGRGDVRIIVNGQREDNNNYLVEGITATDYNVAELTNTPCPTRTWCRNLKCRPHSMMPAKGATGEAMSMRS